MTGKKEAVMILLAESNRGVRDLMRRILQRAGFNVIEAADGFQAATIYEAHNADIRLLIVAARLAHLDGRELAKRCQSINPRLSGVIASGETDEELQAQPPVNNFSILRKPFTPAQLVSLVYQVLAEHPRQWRKSQVPVPAEAQTEEAEVLDRSVS